MYKNMKADFLAHAKNRKFSVINVIIVFLQISSFRLIVLYRYAHFLRMKNFRILSAIMTRLIRISAPVDIEVSAKIGYGVVFPHPLCVVIGGTVEIGNNCKIMQGVSLGGSLGKKKSNGQSQPIIGNNVILGAGAKIVGPVTIGDNAVVGANSVVTKDVPANARAMGIPAKIKTEA